MQFNEMGLDPRILKGIIEMGFVRPTPIQKQFISVFLEQPTDIVGLAQTGTGKTAAFGLPILQRIDSRQRVPQALILSPTRELCVQTAKELKDYAKYLPEIEIIPVYGGAEIGPQLKALAKGVHIITATPGRMHDIIRRNRVDLSKISVLVLDEADEMLNMGFKEDVDAILDQTPETKNTLLFSATMPDEVAEIARNYMNDPFEIAIGKKNSGAENVEHIYHVIHAKDRYLALKRVLDFVPEVYGIVFCRTRQETKEVASQLILDGYSAEALHGDLSQTQRDYVMEKFRNCGVQMLVATDVAARGLDVNDLTHIINYDLPDDLDNYTHRSGRTGRAGKSGISISIIHLKEQGKIKMIEKAIGKKFVRKPIPGGKEICEKQLMFITDKLQKVSVNEDQIHPFLSSVYEKLEHLSREELIKHFVSLEFNRFLDYYGNRSDLNSPDVQESKKKGNKLEELSKFRINVGRLSGISPREIITFVTEVTGKKNVEIGRIELFKKYSIVEVDQSVSYELQKNSRGMHFHGVYYDVREIKNFSAQRNGQADGNEFRERKKSKSYEKTGAGEFRIRNRKKRNY